MKAPLMFLFILIGCSAPEYLTPEELNKYIVDEENGLIKKSEVNGYAIEVTYRPTDLLVQQEVGDEVADENKIKSIRSKYDSYYYFVLNLSKNNKEALQVEGDMGQYSELVQTLSFRMNNFVNLTTSSQDTIPTSDFILNRTFGFSSATSLLFVFNKEKAKDKDWIQFNLNEFGLGVGNQRFRFNTKDIEQTPKIDFGLSVEDTKLILPK